MKRFFCFLFVLVLLPVVSLADLPDLSGLSYDELVQLRRRLPFLRDYGKSARIFRQATGLSVSVSSMVIPMFGILSSRMNSVVLLLV